MKLTPKTIDRLQLKQGQSELVVSSDDVPGLRIRLRANGVPRWEFKFGRLPRLRLGKYPAISPIEAHNTAKQLYAKVLLGQNPAQEIADAKARQSETFGSVVAIYLERRKAEFRPNSFRDVRRHLTVNMKPISGMGIAAVDRRAIATQISRLATKAPTQANRALASVHAFFGWAIGEGLIEHNPATGVNKAQESDARERHLTDDEIRQLWQALPEGDFGDLIRLLLLTGQRRQEIGNLAWSEVDLETGTITLSGKRTKNGRPHIIPMSDAVSGILQARTQNPDRDLVFGERHGGFGGWSRGKAALDAKLKLPAWRIHDLRRTCATGMAELGVQPHVIEAVLNHISGHKAGVAGIYNRASYEGEKVRALALWSDHLAAVISGRKEKIVPMKRA
jgi:integrase